MTEDSELKHVSKKKILFVQLDEDLTSLVDRIQKWVYPELYLMVPSQAKLFQSALNLKILKQKEGELDKKLSIITDDGQGMILCEQAGIPVFHHLSLRESNREDPSNSKSGPEHLAPIPAAANTVSDKTPTRLPKKKISIFEIVRGFREKEKGGFSLRGYLQDRKKNRLPKDSSFQLSGVNRRLVLSFLGFSILVLALIAYIALPGATLYLEPKASSLTVPMNITLSQNPDGDQSLQAYPINTELSLSITHTASDQIFEGENAYGNIRILNENPEPLTLVEGTRFQSPEGIIFRLQDSLNVPAGSSSKPGEVEVYVVADPEDSSGSPVGDRGNIGPSEFTLPALSEDEKKLLYGVSDKAMEGGVTEVRVLVSEDDIEAAKIQLESQLQEQILKELDSKVLTEAKNQNLNLVLFDDPQLIEFGDIEYTVDPDLVGKELDEFEISGSISVSGVAYDQDQLLELLKEEAMSKNNPGQHLVEIDESSITTELFDIDEANQTYTFTAEIWVVQEYILNPNDPEGKMLIDKIVQHVAGLSLEDAQNYIQSLPEINKVEIKMWPFWSNTLPALPENIKVNTVTQDPEPGLYEKD